MKTLKQMSKKAKALGVVGSTILLSTASQAAVVFDESTSK